MALELELKIKADASEAKRELASVEQSITKVSTAAKSTERPIADVAKGLGGYRAETDRVIQSSARLEETTKKLAGTHTLAANATAAQLHQSIMASSGLNQLKADADRLDGKIATLAATTASGTLRWAAYGTAAGVAIAAVAGMGLLLASSAKHYFDHAEATADSRKELERLSEVWDIFQMTIGRGILGGEFSVVAPLRVLETWLIRVGVKIAADIELWRVFANQMSGGLVNAAINGEPGDVRNIMNDPNATAGSQMFRGIASLYSSGLGGTITDPTGFLVGPSSSEAERMMQEADRSRAQSEKLAAKEAEEAIKKRNAFFTWLYTGRASVQNGLSSTPGMDFPIGQPFFQNYLPALTGSSLVWNGANAQFSGLPSMPGTMLPMQMPDVRNGGFFSRAFGNGLVGSGGGGFGSMVGGSIINSIQGGGNIFSGLSGTVGSSMLGTLARTITGGAGMAISGIGGGILNSVLPGVGALAGPLLGKLFGGLFGPSEAEKTGTMRTDAIKEFGGMDALKEAAEFADFSLDKLLSTRKTKDFKAEWERLNAAIKTTETRVAAVQKAVDDLTTSGALVNSEQLKILTGAGNTQQERDALGQFLQGQMENAVAGLQMFAANATITTQQTADSTVAAVSAVFGELMAEGATAQEAIAKLAPTIKTIGEKLKEAGLEGGEAFGHLNELVGFFADEQVVKASNAVQGALMVMTSLANTGLLTQDIFGGLSKSVTDTYNALIQQGKTADQAFMVAQPGLQRIWELQKDFGFETDEATQALITQGLEAGKLGDKFRDPMDRLIKAIDGMVERLDVFLGRVAGLPDRARDAADGMNRAFEDVRYPDAGGGVYPDREQAHFGGLIRNWGVQRFHGGGEVPIMALSGEYVMSRAAVQKYGVGTMHAMNAGRVGGGGPVTIQVVGDVYTDDYTSLNRFSEKVARALEHGYTSRGYQLPS